MCYPSGFIVVDTDRTWFSLAKGRRLNAVYASVSETSIRNDQIGIVLCLDVIEHVKGDSKSVREISRVLKRAVKLF
ncbi:methyltransferase domain-containing protein [Candidatus Bathyarchaeota archaeon]|nr:methyltransferase domain-containing protein [Candidatus Bathyarchaeota archaeon]